MRSSCRAEHFTIGGRNDTTDNVFGADVFVAIIKTEKGLDNFKLPSRSKFIKIGLNWICYLAGKSQMVSDSYHFLGLRLFI